MDNTQNELRSLQSFFTEDIRLIYTIKNVLGKEINLVGQVNNVFNKLYAPNGYTYAYIQNNVLYTDNSYFPMAGTNFIFAVNIQF